MDTDRQRIQDDLRGLLQGEVYCSPVFVQMYATDASIYAMDPLGVVRPHSLADVTACVQYAAAQRIALHPRGAGTVTAGGSLGGGLVVDFSRFMRQTLEIGNDYVRVQPGVVLSQLNRKLRLFGRRFGPDPATAEVSTMGGVLAVNGSGSHWPRYGAARDTVRRLQVVLADGEVIECDRPFSEKSDGASQASAANGSRVAELTRSLSQIIDQHRDTLRATEPRSVINSSGYDLLGAAGNNAVDLTRLFVGSEGTLGLITEATVETHPLPDAIGVALLFFDRLDKAARAALDLRSHDVTACDLMDRRLLRLARESDVRYDVLIPASAEAMLLVELHGSNRADVRDRLRQMASLVCRQDHMAFDARIALDDRDVDFFWRMAQHVVPILYRVAGGSRPVPFVEDMAVPPEQLPEFIVRVQNVLKRHQVTASIFAHAAHGQLHLRPFLELQTEEDRSRLHRLARDLYQEVDGLRGTMSGEHGDGLCRSWYLREQSPARYQVLREVKRLFDPQSILNPGKVADEVPASPTAHLRPSAYQLTQLQRLPAAAAAAANSPAADVKLEFARSPRELFEIVSTCNGCGRCRTTSEAERMCPMFRILPAEEATPRSKANILLGLFTGAIDRSVLASHELRAVTDLCFNCQQCRNECPAGVDIPRLVLECKAQHVAENGLRLIDWWLGRIDLVAAWLSPFRSVVNFGLRSRRFRWLLERMFGLARQRKLPVIEKQNFIQWAAKRQLTRRTRAAGQKVVYFTDIYSNWFDVQLAKASVAVLHHNGVSVYVPPRQVQSGMALIAAGAVVHAKKLARRNLHVLSEAIRQGYHIVASEPSAVLCLTQEYPRMLGSDAAKLVAEHTTEACTYLWQLHQRGQLELDFSPLSLTVGYHTPCHLRALGNGQAGEHLLKLIPGITVRSIDKGCSGMAGTWGLMAANFRNSVRVGWPLIQEMRQGRFDLGATECSTCKMQMEQGTSRPTIHPLKLLAFAYGLMPEIEQLIVSRSGELQVT